MNNRLVVAITGIATIVLAIQTSRAHFYYKENKRLVETFNSYRKITKPIHAYAQKKATEELFEQIVRNY